jgi:predicted AlkP superfamily phosphohydrolase/phosphomutase
MKLLVIGWDGATFNHLEKIRPKFYRKLHRQVLLPEQFWQKREIDSGAAWTTITTGKPFFEHKILSISGKIENETLFKLFSKIDHLIPSNLFGRAVKLWLMSKLFYKNPPLSIDVKSPRIWELIPNSLVWSVPVTHPPKPIHGVWVSGIPYPDSYGVYPKRIERKLKRIFQGEPKRGNDLKKYKRDLFEQHFREIEAIRWLYDQFEFNFAFIVFVLPDRFMHVEDNWDEIVKLYKVIDESTSELVKYIKPDEVVILSDHGMRKERRAKWVQIHDSRGGIIASTDKKLLVKNHLEFFEMVKNYYQKVDEV